MLRPRIIPCLLIHDGGLVKTVGFSKPTYIGDPINAVRIFNEKECDELIVIDIDATVNGVEPDFRTIAHLAAECRMPLCYGGGVSTPQQARQIVGLGVEKVALSSAAANRPALVGEIAAEVGRQSVVVVIDHKKRRLLGGHEVWTHNARRGTKLDPVDFAVQMQQQGAGEIVLNSIDGDGRMSGYDLGIAKKVRSALTIPMTILGGAGALSDVSAAIESLGTIGVAAGSLFVFKGQYRAVLINYPQFETKERLLQDALRTRQA